MQPFPDPVSVGPCRLSGIQCSEDSDQEQTERDGGVSRAGPAVHHHWVSVLLEVQEGAS